MHVYERKRFCERYPSLYVFISMHYIVCSSIVPKPRLRRDELANTGTGFSREKVAYVALFSSAFLFGTAVSLCRFWLRESGVLSVSINNSQKVSQVFVTENASVVIAPQQLVGRKEWQLSDFPRLLLNQRSPLRKLPAF